MTTTVYRQLVGAQQRLQAQKENEAREGRSLHTIETTGVGEVVEAEALKFPNPFVFKPSVAYGAEVLTLPDQTLWALPRVFGAVMKWDINNRGFYLGAFVYVAVDLSPAEGVTPEVQPNVRVEHHFTFSSLAYKSLGDRVMDQVQEASIAPKTISL